MSYIRVYMSEQKLDHCKVNQWNWKRKRERERKRGGEHQQDSQIEKERVYCFRLVSIRHRQLHMHTEKLDGGKTWCNIKNVRAWQSVTQWIYSSDTFILCRLFVRSVGRCVDVLVRAMTMVVCCSIYKWIRVTAPNNLPYDAIWCDERPMCFMYAVSNRVNSTLTRLLCSS